MYVQKASLHALQCATEPLRCMPVDLMHQHEISCRATQRAESI